VAENCARRAGDEENATTDHRLTSVQEMAIPKGTVSQPRERFAYPGNGKQNLTKTGPPHKIQTADNLRRLILLKVSQLTVNRVLPLLGNGETTKQDSGSICLNSSLGFALRLGKIGKCG
jgi:hypothetical protein